MKSDSLVLYKLPQLTCAEIPAMLQVDDIRETRVYQDAKAEGKAEGELLARLRLIARLHAKKLSASEIADMLDLELQVVRREIRKLDK